eukprot:TRINITY_DN93189_c0_g1_i1.p1 TRINITY_DN93189_c0_g1~~TRINITY_DN93189_c0_g1_i1.p1  ORF type:complete len:174 (+),score=34.25 TRINITY_DN93189_c0_g1_i1:129-650(+)
MRWFLAALVAWLLEGVTAVKVGYGRLLSDEAFGASHSRTSVVSAGHSEWGHSRMIPWQNSDMEASTNHVFGGADELSAAVMSSQSFNTVMHEEVRFSDRDRERKSSSQSSNPWAKQPKIMSDIEDMESFAGLPKIAWVVMCDVACIIIFMATIRVVTAMAKKKTDADVPLAPA